MDPRRRRQRRVRGCRVDRPGLRRGRSDCGVVDLVLLGRLAVRGRAARLRPAQGHEAETVHIRAGRGLARRRVRDQRRQAGPGDRGEEDGRHCGDAGGGGVWEGYEGRRSGDQNGW